MPHHPPMFPPIPTETARAAEAILGRENVYMVIGDPLDRLLADVGLDLLDTANDKPASSLVIPAPVPLSQFAERLADRRAAGALRSIACKRLALPKCDALVQHFSAAGCRDRS